MAGIRRWSSIALVASIVGACGGSEATPEPATQAPASVPEVTAEPSVATGFAPDTLLSIIEGPLRVRSKPSVAEDSVKFTPLLETGQRVYVMSGPVDDGTGYTGWYLVRTVAKRVTQDGWISTAARDGTPWAEPAAIDCPEATLADIDAIDAALRIPCFGGREFTFTATVVWGAMCGEANTLSNPDWMAGCLSTFRWGSKTSDVFVAIPPELAGSVGDYEIGDTFKAKVTAHLDDPGARACQPKPVLNADPVILAASALLDCRAMFVATSFEEQ